MANTKYLFCQRRSHLIIINKYRTILELNQFAIESMKQWRLHLGQHSAAKEALKGWAISKNTLSSINTSNKLYILFKIWVEGVYLIQLAGMCSSSKVRITVLIWSYKDDPQAGICQNLLQNQKKTEILVHNAKADGIMTCDGASYTPKLKGNSVRSQCKFPWSIVLWRKPKKKSKIQVVMQVRVKGMQNLH